MLERQIQLGVHRQFRCPRKRQRNTLQTADPFDGAKSTSLFSNNSQISTTLPPRGAKTSSTAANMHTLPATRKTQTTTPAISFAAKEPHTFPATRLDPKKSWQFIFWKIRGYFYTIINKNIHWTNKQPILYVYFGIFRLIHNPCTNVRVRLLPFARGLDCTKRLGNSGFLKIERLQKKHL